MISSSFSFKIAISSLLLSIQTFAASPSTSVKVPIESFARKRGGPTFLEGTLWLSKNKTDITQNTAVLLVHMPGRSRVDWVSFGQKLANSGYNVLTLDLRGKGSQGERSLIEDIQSGVVFLRTDKRILAPKVTIIGANASAVAAARYASATKQMGYIVNSLILLSPGVEEGSGQNVDQKVKLLGSLDSLYGISVLLVAAQDDNYSAATVNESKAHCHTFCREVIFDKGGRGTNILKSKHGPDLEKAVLDFLKRPYA